MVGRLGAKLVERAVEHEGFSFRRKVRFDSDGGHYRYSEKAATGDFLCSCWRPHNLVYFSLGR